MPEGGEHRRISANYLGESSRRIPRRIFSANCAQGYLIGINKKRMDAIRNLASYRSEMLTVAVR